MSWLLILKSPWAWAALAFAAIGSYAAVQHIGWKSSKAEFAQFRADTESLAAAAKVRNAQEATRQALAAQEVLSDLQTRHAALGARYASLRSGSGSGGVPALSSAAASLVACGPKHIESDAATRFLEHLEAGLAGLLEAGDGEIAKYVQLWALEKKNSSQH